MSPHDMMAPLMFGGLVVFMLIGYPVSFSLSAVGLFFGFIAIEAGYFQFSLMQALPERVFGIISNDTLLAIPFFTLMGAILERCGLAEDLLDGLGQRYHLRPSELLDSPLADLLFDAEVAFDAQAQEEQEERWRKTR
jgi:TRAP-type mannitol/chloroaromatic compound transport system permease large subunit